MRKAAIRKATDEELIRRFEETATIHAELRTAKEANRAFDEGVAIWGELKQRGGNALELFLALLQSQSPAVRLGASVLAIFDAPDRSEPVLEQLTNEPQSIGLVAALTLKQWRAGKLKPLV